MASRHWFPCLRKSSLRCSFALSVIIFIFLLAVSFVSTTIYGEHLKDRALDSVRSGLGSDLEHLRAQGDAIADDSVLKELLVAGNQEKLLTFMVREKDNRGIGLMGVTDKEGIIIARTLTTGNRGENALLVSPQGRAVAAGKRPASIEASSFDPIQVLMTTGRPVISGTSTIGALFTNFLLNDEYSARFKSRHLFRGAEISFYTKEYGIYGTSIRNETERSASISYFNVDSDWIKRGRSGDVVRFDSGTYYRVENIVFPGLENSPGGALVFIPYYGYGPAIRAFVVFFTILAFFIFSYHAFRSTKKEQRNRYYIWSAASAFVILLIVIYVVNHAVFARYISLKKMPYVLYNSTLRLQPESGVFDKDFDRPISVLVDTGDEKVNAVGVNITFDPERVIIQDINTERSVCSNLLEKTVDQANKEIRIYCIISPPGFSGPYGIIADIIAKPTKTGTLTLSFSDRTKVLANDGLGTNVLRKANDGSYHVISPSKNRAASSDDDQTGAIGSPIVFSTTHSNGGRWYNSRQVEFVWTAVPGEGYAYAFDQATGTVPTLDRVAMDTKISVTAVSDGIFYFHLAPVSRGSVGPVRHYKVMIDATPPTDVSVLASEDKVSMGDVVRFEFAGEDAMSGLQSAMYIDIDNGGTFLPVGRQTYVPMVDVGTVPVRLRVYDKAGNFTEKERIIRVSGTILQGILRGR